MIPIFKPDGTTALPEILPQNEVPCQWCQGVAQWDLRWAEQDNILYYSHWCPNCKRQTVSEYHKDGTIKRRRGTAKFTAG